jgi:SPP1 gp7 family putative phage head morphogenesis protein
MPFAAAIEHFRGKSVLGPAEFAALAEEIGDWAHQRAFTVARIARADVLNDLHSAVLGAIEDGKTLWEFREEIDRIMEVRGWEGLSPHRLDNILRTNTQAAYNAGRYKQMQRVAERRPYWQYDAVNDRFTRPSHAAHDGKVYDHRHPFWATWFPPNGYRCRCRVTSLSAGELAEEGLTVETRGTDFKPDKGFANSPEEPWRPDTTKYPPQLRRQVEEAIFD